MNRFNKVLLSSTALTFVSFSAVNAMPTIYTEVSDFPSISTGGDTTPPFLIPISGSTGGSTVDFRVDGSIGGSDVTDVFGIGGFTPGQTLSVSVQFLPNASASASGTNTFALEQFFFLNGASLQSVLQSGGASGSGGTSGPIASSSDSGGATASSSDSGGSASGSGTVISVPSIGFSGPFNFSTVIDTDLTVSPDGELLLWLEAQSGAISHDYEISITSEAQVAVDEPSSAAGLALGAAGIGFLAARRRRRKQK